MSRILDGRWNLKRLPGETDKLTKTDYRYLELLTPGFSRHPWTYRYLDTETMAALNGQAIHTARDHVQHLRKTPQYIERADQPKSNNIKSIWNIATAGYRAVQEFHDMELKRHKVRAVPHQLMIDLCAASFELTKFAIEPDIQIDLGEVYPDIHPFAVKNDHHHLLVLFEADTGRNSEPITRSDKSATSIEAKFKACLDLIHNDRLRDTIILFATTGNIRVRSMMECLADVIAEKKYPRHYARYFGFKKINYSKHFDELPPATPWAGVEDWQRAGFPAFNFSRKDA